jgi:glutamyl-tRNA reductase
MVHRIAQKMLHDPLQLLHDKASDGKAQIYADTLRTLFNLELQEGDDASE